MISIIMGVHNGAKGLVSAIESIRLQTYTDWEFVICDDGSTDDSFQLLKQISDKNKKFVIIKNPSNLGLAASLNNCIAHSKGEYIARMDDDDYCYPQRLEKQLLYLENNPEISFVSSIVEIYDGFKVVSIRTAKEFPTIKELLWNSPFVHPATMFRAKDLKAVGGYRVAPETTRGQDYDLFMRMYGQRYVGANLQEVVYRYTVDSNNLKRRTFKARIGECKIRYHGYLAMRVMPWAAPLILKPFVAYVAKGFENYTKVVLKK